MAPTDFSRNYYQKKSLGLGVEVETLAQNATNSKQVTLLKNVLTYRTALTAALKAGKDGQYIGELMEKHEEKIARDFSSTNMAELKDAKDRLQKVINDFTERNKMPLDDMMRHQARIMALTEDQAIKEAHEYTAASKLEEYRRDPFVLDTLVMRLESIGTDRADTEKIVLQQAIDERGRSPGVYTPEGIELVRQIQMLEAQRNGNYAIEGKNQEGKQVYNSFSLRSLIDEAVEESKKAAREPEQFVMQE